MNNKSPYPYLNKNRTRQEAAPTGKDLPLFTHFVDSINTLDTSRLIRFYRPRNQCSSLDFHLVTDKFDRHVIKVIDSSRNDAEHGKMVIREIPYTDLQHIIQFGQFPQTVHVKGCMQISGTEVALSKDSVLEVL